MIPRGDNKWLLRVFVGRDGHGKKKYHSRTLEGTTSQARKALTALLSERDNDSLLVEATKEKVSDFLVRWMEKKRERLTERTADDYQYRIEKHIKPVIGHLTLNKVTPALLETVLYAGLKDRPRTARYAHQILHAAFKQAVRWNLLRTNPCDSVERPGTPRGKKRSKEVLSESQTALFLETVKDDRHAALWVLMLTSALRPQEALALKWTDLEGDLIAIRRVLRRGTNRAYFVAEDSAKTPRSLRSFTLPKAAVAALTLHRQRQAVEIMAKGPQYERNDFVFANDSGRFLDPTYVSKRFTRLLVAAGLPKLRLYAARHTAITHQLAHGVDAMTVAKRAGHSSTTLTTDTYGHLIDSADRRAAEVIDAVLQRAAAM